MTQNLFSNFIGLTDSYKVSHADQLEAGTTDIYSFFESRGGKFSEVVFFGLQYYLKQYLEDMVVTKTDINAAAEDFALHFGNPDIFNRAGWEYIIERHGGRLPIQINAVPEGTVVPTGNVLMTVYNTDPRVPWVTNYVETLLSQIWYPSTVATQSREMKKLILASLRKTGDPDSIPFKLHDFGFRGSTSVEAAAIGGAAHLVNFQGTDTLAALQVTRRIYGERMAGFSVPAAEHSTITSWGRQREVEAFRNMLEAFPSGLVSVVSDSYDVYAACRDLWGSKLKEQVLNRDGVLVVRPDSGNPSEVVVKVLEILGDQFGFEANQKGYKVLNPKVRVIQGDGIDYGSLGNILTAMETAGWSADNVAFGSGGGLLQKVNRDTQRFAFKCSATKIGGVWRDVIKNPITDPGKKSKAGRLALVNRAGVYQTVLEKDAGSDNLLQPVFRNGVVLKEQSFADIRKRAAL